MRILVSGATGLIGNLIGLNLVKAGHQVTVLSRKEKLSSLCFPARTITWDHHSQIPAKNLEDLNHPFDAVIHLAGETVAQRWTKQTKQKIFDSRIHSTKALWNSVKSHVTKDLIWINASAVGYYDETSRRIHKEESPSGTSFLSKVCASWEDATKDIHGRTVCLRFGVVLSEEGGAFPKLVLPYRYGLGSSIGKGDQGFPWIHIEDVVRGILFCLENKSVQGPINLVAPECPNYKAVSQQIAAKLGKKEFFPVPKLMLKLLLGEMSSMLTEGTFASPQKLLNYGFEFKYPTFKSALSQLIPENHAAGTRTFVRRQWFQESSTEIFPFFAKAENLEHITPPWLHFKIVHKSDEELKHGSLIDYQLRLKGLPMKWRTEIQDWRPPHHFSDTQLRGPYALWYHTHSFETVASGTLMTDKVFYQLPFWPLGDIALGMVQRDVKKIFEYRRQTFKDSLSSSSS